MITILPINTVLYGFVIHLTDNRRLQKQQETSERKTTRRVFPYLLWPLVDSCGPSRWLTQKHTIRSASWKSLVHPRQWRCVLSRSRCKRVSTSFGARKYRLEDNTTAPAWFEAEWPSTVESSKWATRKSSILVSLASRTRNCFALVDGNPTSLYSLHGAESTVNGGGGTACSQAIPVLAKSHPRDRLLLKLIYIPVGACCWSNRRESCHESTERFWRITICFWSTRKTRRRSSRW